MDWMGCKRRGDGDSRNLAETHPSLLWAAIEDRLEAKDKEVANLAMGALVSLRSETEPERNYFLNALCLASLKAAGRPSAGA